MPYANLEDRRANDRAYRLRNAETIAARKKTWCEANAQHVSDKKHEHYLANRAEYIARAAKRASLFPEEQRLASRVAAHRRRAAEGVYTVEDVRALFASQDGLCAYCGKELDTYHVDHIVPISRGGTHWPSNLALSCPTCNNKKWAHPLEVFLARISS